MTLVWRRSSRCEAGQCVEIADDGARVLMRDSRGDEAPVLEFGREAWQAFIAGAKDGEFG